MNKSRIIKDYKRDGFKYSKSVSDTNFGRTNRASALYERESIYREFLERGTSQNSSGYLNVAFAGQIREKKRDFLFERYLHSIFKGEGVGNHDFWDHFTCNGPMWWDESNEPLES